MREQMKIILFLAPILLSRIEDFPARISEKRLKMKNNISFQLRCDVEWS